MGARNVGPRDMFVARLERRTFLTQANMVNVAINHDEGSPDFRFRKGSVLTEIKNTSVIDFSDISDEQMNEMIDGTLTDFDEGDLVDGVVVKLEHDEVLVDIGFKSEGVIPSRELSIRKDADPADIVSLGEKIEALVLQKEDKDGRLILSKKRAEYERAWIRVEEKFKAGEVVTGEVIEVVKGGLILDIGLRGFLPASLVDPPPREGPGHVPGHRDRGPRHRNGPQPQQRRAVAPRAA